MIKGFLKTPHQMFSLAIQKLSFACGKDFLFSAPPSIILEPTNACNLQCITCRKKNVSLEKSGFMNVDSAKNLLREIGKPLVSILFNGFGEPLLHPQFCDFLNFFYADFPRIKIRFFTNGILFSDKIIESLIHNQVYEIIISLDSATEETYQKIRGADFSRVLQNIRKLNDAKRHYGKKLPYIKASFTIVEQNRDEVEKFFELLASLHIKPGLIEPVNTKWGYGGELPQAADLKKAYKKCREIFPDLELKSIFPSLSRYSHPICPLPFVPYVAWNGDLKACCYMPLASEYPLGNVFTSPFYKVWHNKENRYLRRELLHNRLLAFCNDCSFIHT